MVITLEETEKIYTDKQHANQLKFKMLRARHFNEKAQDYNNLLREMIIRGNRV